MKELEYPFDAHEVLRERRKWKKALLENKKHYIKKRIAILGGSTTRELRELLEIFLLNQGIKAEFYESGYGRFWEEAVFDNSKLDAFLPEIVIIHTNIRNMVSFPMQKTQDVAVNEVYEFYHQMWESLEQKYGCMIIQNNFEYPIVRKYGNQDAVRTDGNVRFVNLLNERFYTYANAKSSFYICDIQYLSAVFGLDSWLDAAGWYMYKYAMSIQAMPLLAFHLSNIVKAALGKSKKALVLDLDNTLWGGVIGEEGENRIDLNPESAYGQIFLDFHKYLLTLKQRGILLTVSSKNDYETGLQGLKDPESILKPEDFQILKINWERKSSNIREIAKELNILEESLVFVDDNPAEREEVRQSGVAACVPEFSCAEEFVTHLERSGLFEVSDISADDLGRNAMYYAETERKKMRENFSDYKEYLKTLQMEAVIEKCSQKNVGRITQLVNKCNQFNVTTKRFTQAQMEEMQKDDSTWILYGSLKDKFGSNGIVTVLIAKLEGGICHIILWVMSCRVLKRDLEYAMLDALAEKCTEQNIQTIKGYYYPSGKNELVKDLYQSLGFEKVQEDSTGNTVWERNLKEGYRKQNDCICITKSEEE